MIWRKIYWSSYTSVLNSTVNVIKIDGSTMNDWLFGIRYLDLLECFVQIQSRSVVVSCTNLLGTQVFYNAVLTAQSRALEIFGSTMSDWFLGIRYLGLLGMLWQKQAISVEISGNQVYLVIRYLGLLIMLYQQHSHCYQKLLEAL